MSFSRLNCCFYKKYLPNKKAILPLRYPWFPFGFTRGNPSTLRCQLTRRRCLKGHGLRGRTPSRGGVGTNGWFLEPASTSWPGDVPVCAWESMCQRLVPLTLSTVDDISRLSSVFYSFSLFNFNLKLESKNNRNAIKIMEYQQLCLSVE